MGVLEFDPCRNRKLGQQQSVIAKRASFGRYTCPRVLEDALAIYCNEARLGKFSGCALGETFFEFFFVAFIQKMERSAAYIFTVVRESYRYMPAAGLREHLECSQIPIVLKLLDDHGFEIHLSAS